MNRRHFQPCVMDLLYDYHELLNLLFIKITNGYL